MAELITKGMANGQIGAMSMKEEGLIDGCRLQITVNSENENSDPEEVYRPDISMGS